MIEIFATMTVVALVVYAWNITIGDCLNNTSLKDILTDGKAQSLDKWNRFNP